MFFPISTDRQFKSTPWVNYGLIAANVVVYAFTWQSSQQYAAYTSAGYLSIDEIFQNAPGVGLWLWPDAPYTRLYQFITYQFLHSGPEPIPLPLMGIQLPLHLIFNMLFLYVFGNAVEDRMGKVGYLTFYLAGGVLAGLAHIADPNAGPVLGASGSVAAVTGLYLALFPLSNVTIAYWLIVFIGSFVVSSVVLIVFRVVLDLIFHFGGYGNTAYVAHLAGYLYGFIVGLGLLMVRLLPREPYDMLALIEQKRRRSQFKRLAAQGFAPWDHAAPGSAAAGTRGKGSGSKEAAEPTPEDRALMERRAEVSQAVSDQDLASAAERYVRLLKDYPGQVMPQGVQLDLANQLMAGGRYDSAAQAYELFLETYRDYGQQSQIQLILGLIYARYLKQAERARELLNAARPRLDAGEQALADQALAEIAG
ncbi:MAG: rhomboid family intramembrane serine protease [Planctomycetota bacterium]